MRPHRLTLTAFGSFPGTETVDFDALAEAGLFLVHGPTGAGKTTILDALCFALYGQVPGQRNSARSLRCDHAPPGTGPSVTLEVSIRGRLLRIQRSPAWQRPKLRGTGFTEEKAKVVVSEWQGSDWHGLTTRLDEAGDLIGGLLGMNADQFCQVAMLPQGDFARFLRAGGDERAKLLERLFSVKVFTAAESWLAEHRKQAWREAQELRQEVDFAVKRVEEAAGPDLLGRLTSAALGSAAAGGGVHATLAFDDDPAPAARGEDASAGTAPASDREGEAVAAAGRDREAALRDGRAGAAGVVAGDDRTAGSADGQVRAAADGQGQAVSDRQGRAASDEQGQVDAGGEAPSPEEEPLRWAGALLDAARAVVTRAEEEHAAAGAALRAARTRFEQAAALAERQRRYAEALTLRRILDERADERADLQAILDDAARADRVVPLVTAARQRAEAAAKARALAADAIARARPLLTSAPPAGSGHPSGAPRQGAPAPGPTAQRPTAPGADAPTAQRPAAPGAAAQWPAGKAPATESPSDQGRIDAGAPSAGELAALERARQDEIARLQELLTEEARLSVVRRDLLRVEDELAELLRADERVSARLAELPALIERAEAGLAAARTDAARIPAAKAARDAAAHLIEIDRELAALAEELDVLAQREAEVAAAEAELPARLAEAEAALDDVRAQAAAIPAQTAALEAARAALEATHRREALAAELEEARAAHQVLVDQAQAARERWLDLRQARIDGMAAELARDLADGQPCAVCGSEHHPQPAKPAPSAPSADDEREAEAAHDAALSEREAAERALASLESRHADAAAATGDLDVAAAEEQVQQAEQELARLQAIADREPALAQALERVEADRERVRDQAREIAEALAAHRAHRAQREAERARVRAQLDLDPDAVAESVLAEAERELRRLQESAAAEPRLAQEVARLGQERNELEEQSRQVAARLAAARTRQEELSGDAGRLTARLDAARGGDATLTARLSRLSDEAELLREALEATQAAVSARDELARAKQAAEEAAAEAGFGDVRDAEAAYRSQAERERKAELLRRLDDQHAAVSGVLADPELVAAAAEPAPDLAAVQAERDALEETYTRLASVRDRAAARARRLAELHDELAGHLERWRPAADRHRLAERMASLASGTSSDNQWSMSLSSFVLGERLRQVVAAANERLDHMSGGRYLLRHDLGKTAGSRTRAGGGLGLRVVDGWTGVDRDPATLSGGESFITSLALALGLADVVTAEAGGAELGTLFVDEGFGTLDEDTLDGVLDILDGLRDGGRAVGIVSHVSELRSRITAQLKVIKTRTGSTLRAAGTG
ncbi:AAA family ATPase [Nonomuraea sp. N2-4H]|uniref:AAA family ATPase n=1 Tax=Nonomuraea sp. N2-4H TaxID=3128898 RepID=UPI003252DF47